MKVYPIRADGSAVSSSSRLSLISAAECAAAPHRRYIMKGTIAAGDVAIVIGSPGAGKSALAPMIGYAVAQGRSLFSRRVRAGKVLYVAAEDQHGMRSRVAALRQRHGDAPTFHLVDGVTDLFGKAGQADELRALVKLHRPAIVVIDTVAAAFLGLRENESDDMGKVIRLARDLAQGEDNERGPAVILLHHPPKADDSTPRGHGNLNGDADVVLRLSKEAGTGVVTASFTKNRNGPSDGVQFSFTIEAVVVGQDEDGDDITAPVAVECSTNKEAGKRLPPTQRRALNILASAIVEHGKPLPPGPRYPSLTYGVDEAAWRDACENERLSTSEKLDDRQRVFRAAYKGLLVAGNVGTGEGLVWIACPVGPDRGSPL